MCAPILGAAVGIMQSVAQFGAQQQDYEAKSAAWRQNVTNSFAAGRQEQAQVITKAIQEDDAKSLKQQQTNIEEAQKVATAENSASESGVAGLSVDGMVADMRRKAAFNRQVDQRNFENQVYQNEQDMLATNTRIQDRINSVERPVSPSPLGMIAGSAGAAMKLA